MVGRAEGADVPPVRRRVLTAAVIAQVLLLSLTVTVLTGSLLLNRPLPLNRLLTV